MIRILFLINTLGGGGAEKALVNLVNNMDRDRFDITVETMFGDGVNAKLLSENIKYISKKAPCPRGIAYILRFFSERQLYRYFVGKEKYDIIAAFMHGAPVKVIAGCPDKSVLKLGWLHNGNPETGTFFRFWINEKKAFNAYRSLDRIVGVSDTVSKAFSTYSGIDNVVTVYNTNDTKIISELSRENVVLPFENKTVICSVGRIVKEKGFDRLVKICVRLHNEGENIALVIVGDGDRGGEIRALVKELGAEEYIYLPGYDVNPYKYVRKSDIFVCSSLTEGLSTAVTEAVILGIPCVSTDVSGAKEILGDNNEYGIVTENNDEALYSGIKTLLCDKELRNHYACQSAVRADSFQTENTVKQAEDLMLTTIKK